MDVIVIDNNEPAKKKLKQTRLPFQILPPKVKIGEPISGKKRKLDTSVSEGETVPKQIRSEVPVVTAVTPSEVPEEEVLPPLGEREKNQPDISTIFLKKDCYVDLSKSRVASPVDDSVNETDVSVSELDDTAQSLDCSLPVQDNKENVEVADNDQNEASNFLQNLKLTPRQLQKKLDAQKRVEERERQRQEKLDLKKREREEKEEQRRKEREEKEEQRRKEREEKDEQKRKEKEEKEEQKRKEKEEKDEQRRKEKEERDRKKQEEIERKENERKQQELKKKRVSEAFVKFFVPKDSEKDTNTENVTQNFMPFAVKSDMRVAPLFRTTHFNEDRKRGLEETLGAGVDKEGLYLSEIKSGKRETRKSERTWKNDEERTEDDIVCVEDESEVVGNEILIGELAQPTLPTKMRVKLLQFQENRRPPYWGTWRKKSSLIKPRRPIGTDSKLFDYEIDSDDEWEEEEPGESLRGSDDEKDSDCDEKENEYEIDNEFMVPHGYLSEEEEALNEEDGLAEHTDDDNDTHKEKLKALEMEFQKERSEKTERLRPRIFGCIWANSANQVPQTLPESMKRYFSNHQILFNDPVILTTKDVTEFVTSPDRSPVKKIKRVDIPEKYYPDLIRLLHGNTNGKKFLFKEFQMFLSSIEESLRTGLKRFEGLLKKLEAQWIACPEEGPLQNKLCWYVKSDIREKYNPNVTLPNNWNYILTPRRQVNTVSEQDEKVSTPKTPAAVSKTSNKVTKTPFAITKFTKVLSEDERQKQFATASKSPSGVKTPVVAKPVNATKKRVQLTTLNSTCSIFKKIVKDDAKVESSGEVQKVAEIPKVADTPSVEEKPIVIDVEMVDSEVK